MTGIVTYEQDRAPDFHEERLENLGVARVKSPFHSATSTEVRELPAALMISLLSSSRQLPQR